MERRKANHSDRRLGRGQGLSNLAITLPLQNPPQHLVLKVADPSL